MTGHRFALAIANVEPAQRIGSVTKVTPDRIEANGPLATRGDLCEIKAQPDRPPVLAEIVAAHERRIVLVPFDPSARVAPGALVRLTPSLSAGPVGQGYAGRAIDAFAHPIDNGPAILSDAHLPLSGTIMPPLERKEPEALLETGIRVIDGLLTLGIGQRIGIFAASGVGKTTLIKQIAAQTSYDRCVLCLVGERGREVELLWRDLSALGERITCVAATSDQSAPLRARCVEQALCLAEYWRAQGEHVLLIVDSVTRLAMALREIGLAAGAPPTLRAYTPNVFATLPRIVERCGAAKSGGAISAIMTVLSETDDVDDPIVETMKSLLDGHIVLSRQLSEQGRFPAVDVLKSVSRQAQVLMPPAQAIAARRVLTQMSVYEDAKIMIESGVYKSGASASIDAAINARPGLSRFLQQDVRTKSNLAATIGQLASLGGAVTHE